MNNRIYSVVLMSLLCVAAAVAANGTGRQGEPRGEGANVPDERLEQLRQEGQQYVSQLDQTLKQLLEVVNRNQRPDDALISSCEQLVEDGKRLGRVLTEKDKSKFMLVESWIFYHQGFLPMALNWSQRACRTYEPAQDNWNSQVLFSLLNDKKPLKPRPQRQPEPRPNSRRAETTFETPTAPAYSESGTLNFDLRGMRDDMAQQRFTRLQMQTISGQTFEYSQGAGVLCMLLWQSDGGQAEGTPNAQQQPQGAMPAYDAAAVPGSAYDSQKTTLSSQQAYFKTLMDACKDSGKVQFIQINTGSPKQGQPQEDALQQTVQTAAGIPTVIAAQPGSGADMFKSINAKTPFMMIVNKEGSTLYAGTAADFMPAFILTDLTGVPIDLQKQTQSTTQDMALATRMLEYMGTAPVPPANGAADPNKPAVDPNAPTLVIRPSSGQTEPDFPTQALEDQVRAEKLLQSAQMHIEESRKLSMKNPQQGIEDARQVLAEFPNTEYAQKARELLRRVPERWKTRHNITNEELGY